VLCLVAGIHGDELNGVAIVREALEHQEVESLRGTLIGVPIVNLFGFWNQSRYLPDRRDLNRHFPGRKTGSIASRIAQRLWQEVIVHCTHIVDFHTGSLHRANLSQVRADLRRPMSAELARAFGSGVLIHNPGARGTLRAAALEVGIPSILYEAGETLRFQRGEIDLGRQGVARVMAFLKMIEAEPPPADEVATFLETHWARAPAGGLLELEIGLGDTVAVGQTLGVITDPLRRNRRTVTSAWAGRVVGLVLAPVVIPGMAVVHVGIPHGRMERSEIGEELEVDSPE
jgi:predicted deacylase